jgi:hypothetical protein
MCTLRRQPPRTNPPSEGAAILHSRTPQHWHAAAESTLHARPQHHPHAPFATPQAELSRKQRLFSTSSSSNRNDANSPDILLSDLHAPVRGSVKGANKAAAPAAPPGVKRSKVCQT